MTEVDVVELSLAIVAVIIAGVGLTIGSTALAIVIGIKNSTHQIVWKDQVPPTKDDVDPFGESFELSGDDQEYENPNKKLKKQEKKEDEVHPDLEDMTSASNDWK